MPTLQMVHIDQALTNISIGYKNEAYIADEIFKPLPVQKQSDKYYVYGMEMFRQHDDLRAPGTEANEITWTLSGDQYFCEGHALRHAIPDEELQNADPAFNIQADAVELITDGILLNKEVDAANLVLNPNNYAPGLSVVMGSNGAPAKWDDYTNSNPRLDIAKAKQAVHKRSGVRPNTLIISEPVLNTLLLHPKLIQVIQYVQAGILTLDQLKVILGVENILVGSALKSSVTNAGQANPGSPEPLDYIWGNSAVLAYIPKAPARKQVALGYTFMWNKDNQGAIQVRQWYDISRRATFVEAERWYAHKIVSNVAGFLFVDVIDPVA